jgi:ribonucleotide monophosphatase NagD (HAD superfamily)
LGKEAIPGAKELLDALRSRGKHVLFVSNTSSRSRLQCIEQFTRADIQIADEELFLASEETSQYIARLKPKARAYVLGAKGLYAELEKEGIEILPSENVDPQAVDFVVVGRDQHPDIRQAYRGLPGHHCAARSLWLSTTTRLFPAAADWSREPVQLWLPSRRCWAEDRTSTWGSRLRFFWRWQPSIADLKPHECVDGR